MQPPSRNYPALLCEEMFGFGVLLLLLGGVVALVFLEACP